MEEHEVIVIGGGPAGLAAAAAAKGAGARDVVVLEREDCLGGILNQCIHSGFGLHRFHEELTGPEYARRFIDAARAAQIDCRTDSTVIELTPSRELTVVGRGCGLRRMRAGALVLAMGCRERPRGALNLPGFRPAGVYSAGTAQRMINLEGRMPGREVVILGSGDIGLIMARRLTLEGARVKLVAELMPYSSGLRRNRAQCLDDFGIPLLLSHTVVDILGKRRVEGVVLAKVDAQRRPIAGTQRLVACDTLLLSVGLIPENELSEQAGIALDTSTSGPIVCENLQTGVPGIFACGNVLHVHDLVDQVSEEAEFAGRAAARFALGQLPDRSAELWLLAGRDVGGVVPQRVDPRTSADALVVRFRVRRELENHFISVYAGDRRVLHQKRRILTPGQMETLTLKRALLEAGQNLRIEIEDE